MKRSTVVVIMLAMLVVAGLLSYFAIQTITLRGTLRQTRARLALTEDALVSTQAALRAKSAPVAPVALPPTPSASTLAEKCSPPLRATLDRIEKDYGMGHLDCRVLGGDPSTVWLSKPEEK